MSDRAKKISELPLANSASNNDLFVLVANVAGTLTTRKLTVNTFRTSITNIDQANSTTTGVVGVGDQLAINATGFLSANINIANTTSKGVVKIGSQLTVNTDGYLNANLIAANTSTYGTVKIGANLAVNGGGFLTTNLNTANTTVAGVVTIGDQLVINATGYIGANINIANTTSKGVVIVGDQLAVNATGFLNANLRAANTTSAGTVKVGDQLDVNATGFLNANLKLATDSEFGVVKVGNNILHDGGTIYIDVIIANTTAPGFIVIGDQLSITAEGVASANINIANTTSKGVIIVGDQLSVNATGFLNANLRTANSTAPGVIIAGENLTVNATGYLNANISGATASELTSNGFTLSISEANGNITLPDNITRFLFSGTGNTTLYSNAYVMIESNQEDQYYTRVGVFQDRAFIYVNDFGTESTWTFDQDGLSTLPGSILTTLGSSITLGNSTINTAINASSISTTSSNDGLSIVWSNTTLNSTIRVSNNGVNLSSNGFSILLDRSGALTVPGNLIFPDTSIQNTAFKLVSAPANSTATGDTGQIAFDSDYIYYCTAIDTWKRVGLSSW